MGDVMTAVANKARDTTVVEKCMFVDVRLGGENERKQWSMVIPRCRYGYGKRGRKGANKYRNATERPSYEALSGLVREGAVSVL